MVIYIGRFDEKAVERAFARALRRVIRANAEAAFATALAKDSPIGKGLEEKIEQGLRRFIQDEAMTNRPATLGEQL